MASKKRFIEAMDKVATTLRNAKLTHAQEIAILECLKQDIIMNEGCVVITGKSLVPVSKVK